MTLTDTESLAVLDGLCCIEREHDTKAGLRVVVADNGFQDWHTEYELSAYDLDCRVHHRGSKPIAVAHNVLNQMNRYTQRWMAETSYSTTKRTQDSALRSRFWYRQFREIVLTFALHNLKKTAKTLCSYRRTAYSIEQNASTSNLKRPSLHPELFYPD